MAFPRLRASVARIDGRFAGGFLRAEGVAFLVIETVQGINVGLGAGDNDVRVVPRKPILPSTAAFTGM